MENTVKDFPKRYCTTKMGLCSWTDKELIDSKKFFPSFSKDSVERLRFYATKYPCVG
jgi:hypothetical protein